MTTRFYLPETYIAERELAEYIKRAVKQPCQKIESVSISSGNNSDSDTTALDETQSSAVTLACTSSFSLLRGGPGTGKTTTTRKIVESFDKAGMRGIIMCPTGKASKRADQVINDPELPALNNPPFCTTMHTGLEWKEGDFQRNRNNPLDFDYVGIDEGSMAGLKIMNSVMAAIDPKRTRVFMVGDVNQLPSVDPGNVMHDIITCRVAPETNLTKLYRQGKYSGIAYNASRVLAGEKLSKSDPRTSDDFEDFYFLQTDSPAKSYEKILDLVCHKIPASRDFDSLKDIQVLVPGKKGACGVDIVNDELRKRLNSRYKEEKNWRTFRIGDKLINRQNNWKLNIVNGDVGVVLDVGKNGIEIDFGAGTGVVKISNDDRCSLHLAYAFTVHSSQGSEFPCVVMPIHTSHWKLLYRNVLYTGMTRPKTLLVLIGDPKAVLQCINNTVVDKRETHLQRWLRESVL